MAAACPICYEEIVPLTTLSLCGHAFCRPCLTQYLLTEETTGERSATCPSSDCPQALSPAETLLLLGRPFQPAGGATLPQGDNCMDEATTLYMEKETRLCGGCGARVLKSSGCNKMQCLCGYRFCYKCGAVGAKCSCDGVGHGFFDNVLLQPDFSFFSTPAELDQIKMDMRTFLETKRAGVAQQDLVRRRQREEKYQARKQQSEERKAKIIQRIIQNDVDLAVELYYLEVESCRGTPVWSGELTPYLRFLGKSEIEAVFPGVPCPKVYFPPEQQESA